MQHLWIYTVKPCVLIVDKCDELSTLIPSIQEEFEDTKGVIRIHKSKKDRQHNGQKNKFQFIWLRVFRGGD